MRTPHLIRFISTTLCIGAILIQCSRQEPEIESPSKDQILTSFGDRNVSVRDFLIAFQESLSFDSVRNETQKAVPKIVESLSKTIVFQRDLAQKAREIDLDAKDDFIESHKNTVNDELYQKVILHDVLEKIRVTDKEIRRFYDENRDVLYVNPESNQIVVKGIYVYFGDKRSKEEAQKIVENAEREIEKGDTFQNVAQKYSDAPERLRGKENTNPLGMFPPEIAQHLEPLQDGECTPPFEYKDRFYIFKRIRFIEPEYFDFDSVKDSIRMKLTQEKKNNGVFLLSQELRQKHNLITNPTWLEKPDSVGEDAIVLSVPNVYELTVGEFLELAKQQQKWTILEQKNYLDFLGNKAVCLAEALERGWGESDVSLAVEFWDNQRLARDYILSEVDKQVRISEEQIRQIYEANRASIKTPVRFDIDRLFFSIPMTTYSTTQFKLLFANAKARATAAREAMLKGASMEEAAAPFKNQEDIVVTTASMKNVSLNELSSRDREIVNPSEDSFMQQGEISEPIETNNIIKERYGYELFIVRNVVPSRAMTYEEAKEIICRGLASKQSEIVRKQLETSFFEKHRLQYNERGMQAVIDYLSELANKPDLQADIARYELSTP